MHPQNGSCLQFLLATPAFLGPKYSDPKTCKCGSSGPNAAVIRTRMLLLVHLRDPNVEKYYIDHITRLNQLYFHRFVYFKVKVKPPAKLKSLKTPFHFPCYIKGPPLNSSVSHVSFQTFFDKKCNIPSIDDNILVGANLLFRPGETIGQSIKL